MDKLRGGPSAQQPHPPAMCSASRAAQRMRGAEDDLFTGEAPEDLGVGDEAPQHVFDVEVGGGEDNRNRDGHHEGEVEGRKGEVEDVVRS